MSREMGHDCGSDFASISMRSKIDVLKSKPSSELLMNRTVEIATVPIFKQRRRKKKGIFTLQESKEKK